MDPTITFERSGHDTRKATQAKVSPDEVVQDVADYGIDYIRRHHCHPLPE